MRLIDADELKDKLQILAYDDWNQGISVSFADALNDCVDVVDEIPTVDPVKRGIWVGGICSECEKYTISRIMVRGEVVWEDSYEYCPHCGAKMG